MAVRYESAPQYRVEFMDASTCFGEKRHGFFGEIRSGYRETNEARSRMI